MCRTKIKNAVTDQSLQIEKTSEYEQVGNVFTCFEKNAAFMEKDSTETTCERIAKQIRLKVEVLGKELMFLWDTGSTCSMVGIEGYKMLGSPKCEQASTVLKAYGGRPLDIFGKMCAWYQGWLESSKETEFNRC